MQGAASRHLLRTCPGLQLDVELSDFEGRVLQGEREQTMREESATDADDWQSLSDDLLAGLVHGLNNRVTAMSVCAELIALGDSQMASGGMLTAEVERLHRASALIALLSARKTCSGPKRELSLARYPPLCSSR